MENKETRKCATYNGTDTWSSTPTGIDGACPPIYLEYTCRKSPDLRYLVFVVFPMVTIHRSDDFRLNIWRTQRFLCLTKSARGRNIQRYPWWIYEEREDVRGEYPQCCCRVGATSPVLSLNVLMCLSIKKRPLKLHTVQ